MPFTADGKFYHDRRLDMHTDTWKAASEKLGHVIETYLFDTEAPGYMNPDFLSWGLAVYDATKNSSGNVDVIPFDAPEMKLEPIPSGKRDTLDKTVRFSPDMLRAQHDGSKGDD